MHPAICCLLARATIPLAYLLVLISSAAGGRRLRRQPLRLQLRLAAALPLGGRPPLLLQCSSRPLMVMARLLLLLLLLRLSLTLLLPIVYRLPLPAPAPPLLRAGRLVLLKQACTEPKEIR